MRNVVRVDIPASLQANGDAWTQELLETLRRGDKPSETLYSRYDRPDIKEALRGMYSRRCCYCDARVAVIAAGQVEHRKPKRGPHAFPEATYDWDNLHWACPACNRAKFQKWNSTAEIIDPVVDVPISNHLEYRYREHVYVNAKTNRGATTCDHADLNRPDLVNARTHLFSQVLELIYEINTQPSGTAQAEQAKLESLRERDFGSLVTWAVESFAKWHTTPAGP